MRPANGYLRVVVRTETADPNPAHPGVVILGCHRSGTSLVGRIVRDLGVAAGPATRVLPADRHNPDGYFEDLALVDWHDGLLQRSRGWASAPPITVTGAEGDDLGLAAVLAPYPQRTWFVKDPRQCVLLDHWTNARGLVDSAIVVVRDPRGTVASLRSRSGYSLALGLAIWERSYRDLLATLTGRRTMVIAYEQLTSQPESTIAEIARFVGTAAQDDAALPSRIAATVRSSKPVEGEASDATAMIDDQFRQLTGCHETFPRIDPGELSATSRRVLETRRRRLNLIRPLRVSSSIRKRLDEAYGRLRR